MNASSSKISPPSKNITLSNASLDQNAPNPFSRLTSINYTVPASFYKAAIIITDINGKTIKQLNITSSGKGSVNLDASALASGTYSYSLIIDGKISSAKQTILLK